MPGVDAGDLWAIPVEHREVIARWLLQRAENYRPSIFLSLREAERIREALQWAAVDIADMSEDSTYQHAADVIKRLGSAEG